MIVVDSSVWIANLRDADLACVHELRSIWHSETLLVGDIVLLEVLQGARGDADAAMTERDLRCFPVVPMLGEDLAAKAARNYRLLRARGITVRKLADLIIGTYCIEHGHALLHNDRDFDPMAEHLGLQIA